MKKFVFSIFLCALALAACGSDGESEEDKVVEVVQTWTTTTDPADCKRLANLSFNEQVQSLEGVRAITNCEEDVEETRNDPESVEVRSVAVKGSKATADAVFEGGPFDGQGLSLALVEKGGAWKLDEITGFTQFDHDRMVAAYRKGTIESGAGALNPELVPCVGEALAGMSRPELEEVVLGGSPLPIEKVLEGC